MEADGKLASVSGSAASAPRLHMVATRRMVAGSSSGVLESPDIVRSLVCVAGIENFVRVAAVCSTWAHEARLPPDDKEWRAACFRAGVSEMRDQPGCGAHGCVCDCALSWKAMYAQRARRGSGSPSSAHAGGTQLTLPHVDRPSSAHAGGTQLNLPHVG